MVPMLRSSLTLGKMVDANAVLWVSNRPPTSAFRILRALIYQSVCIASINFVRTLLVVVGVTNRSDSRDCYGNPMVAYATIGDSAGNGCRVLPLSS